MCSCFTKEICPFFWCSALPWSQFQRSRCRIVQAVFRCTWDGQNERRDDGDRASSWNWINSFVKSLISPRPGWMYLCTNSHSAEESDQTCCAPVHNVNAHTWMLYMWWMTLPEERGAPFISTAELMVAGSSPRCRLGAAALHNNTVGLGDVKHPEFMRPGRVYIHKNKATFCFFNVRLLHHVITRLHFSWGE